MVHVMPNRSQKKVGEPGRQADPGPSASGDSIAVASPEQHVTDSHNSTDVELHEVPRWRQIEIMRERAQLREALGDIDFDLEDYEEEVFGSEEENESLYVHGDNPADEDIDLPDEDIDPDDFDDFEED